MHVLIQLPVLITGVSPNSIGAALALAISSHEPALLILGSRTLSKIQAITKAIHASNPHVNVKEVVVDLSRLQDVRRAAGEIKRIVEEHGKGIDVLFNNAGINVSERRLTEEVRRASTHVMKPFAS